MTKPIQYVLTGAALLMCGLSVWGGMGLTKHAIVALDKWGNAAPDLKPTLEAISGPRGTLHEVNKAVVAVKDAVITTQIQERAIAPHTVAAVDALNTAAHSLDGTANAASTSLTALTADLQTAQPTIAATKPLLDASTQAVQHFDALVSDPVWTQVGKNVVGMTQSGDLILADGSRVSKRFADDYTKKQTPWMRIWHYGGDALDMAGWLARHD